MSKSALPRSVLVFALGTEGGIPLYVHHQAEELARRGIAVTMICPPDHPAPRDGLAYRQLRVLPRQPRGRGAAARIGRVLHLVRAHTLLLWWIARLRPSAVLLDAVSDFCAALWAAPHLLLAACGLPYFTTLHDPVRALWYGPVWFDRLSLWASYRMLAGALIHGDPPAGAYLPPHLALEVVPHGLFARHEPDRSAAELRAELDIAPDAFLLLSFGHIADRKNQHLLVEAVSRLPHVALVIAGPQMAQRNRPPQFYRDLAERLGCADRVRVLDRFIPDGEAAALFSAADAVALTYDGTFASQSGVLQMAAQWDKPVLASSGEGPLRETVEQHGIGVFIQPDSADAIVEGLGALGAGKGAYAGGFASLRQSASWSANIDGFLRLWRRV